MSTEDARIPVEFYFDYICPFCYVGSHRLRRITQRYPVSVQYRFVEIHPDNPSQGRPVEALGYPAAQWAQMTEAVTQMARDEGLPLAERRFTTNSRRALLLARTVLRQRPDAFLGLHDALFHAYFAEQHNIGYPEVLVGIARGHGVEECLTAAWEQQDALAGLLEDVEAAQAIGLTGVPTLVVGGRAFPGAVSTDTLEAALEREGVTPSEDD